MVSFLAKLFGVRTAEAGTPGILNLCRSDATAWVAEDTAT